jgi:hypothetical protein
MMDGLRDVVSDDGHAHDAEGVGTVELGTSLP